jgi:hypothetical protein
VTLVGHSPAQLGKLALGEFRREELLDPVVDSTYDVLLSKSKRGIAISDGS